MGVISERELDRITAGIYADRESIIKHNPLGTDGEILLWMLLSCLVSYLSLEESETPCFPGRPDVDTYVSAIQLILRGRKSEPFDEAPYITLLLHEHQGADAL